jgi:hypothetical protein
MFFPHLLGDLPDILDTFGGNPFIHPNQPRRFLALPLGGFAFGVGHSSRRTLAPHFGQGFFVMRFVRFPAHAHLVHEWGYLGCHFRVMPLAHAHPLQ